MALERTIIRHLYGRPLETLLATGDQPDAYPAGEDVVWRAERGGGKPGRLSGGVQVLPNLILPWNRLAVLAFVLLVLCFTAHPEPHPSGDERPRRDAEPGDGRLLRRAYRAGGYAGLWPRLRYCRAGRRGAVAAWQRRPELGQDTSSTRFWWWCWAASASWPAAWRRPLGWAFSTKFSNRKWARCWARS